MVFIKVECSKVPQVLCAFFAFGCVGHAYCYIAICMLHNNIAPNGNMNVPMMTSCSHVTDLRLRTVTL